MYYEVYLDSLFLVNFVMNLLCLEIANFTFLKAASRRRIIGGAALGAFFYLLPFLTPGPAGPKSLAGLFLSAAGMILVTFRTRSLRAFWMVFQRLLLSSFLLGGCLLFLIRLFPALRETLTSVLGVLGIGLLLFMEVSFLVGKSGERKGICQVKLQGNGPAVEVRALLDSGNSLVEPISGKPVCILDRSVFEKLWEKGKPDHFRAIPYHSLGRTAGILAGYLIPKMEIDLDGTVKSRRNVYVGVSEERIAAGGGYEMILNPGVLKEDENDH